MPTLPALSLLVACGFAGWAIPTALTAADSAERPGPVPTEDLVLNYHLMHPGGDSGPADPNAAFFLDGTYHLHYILKTPWQGKDSFSFIHVTSPDMLHWTWQKTSLQPSFTGHGMFSGTGFMTKEGKPAIIYHGQKSGKNQIAIAKDASLNDWEKPYPIDVRNSDGTEVVLRHWDPDCFLIGDTYYAVFGGINNPLLKSTDLKSWTKVGKFLDHDMPDVGRMEDMSCPNFFKLDNTWMWLGISHNLGCRYYLGDWDAKVERFIPRSHGRMNWRREDQIFWGWGRLDVFAPESVLAADGRRVMWAWLNIMGSPGQRLDVRSIQSLPRELSVPADGILRMKPLRELETLRYDPVTVRDVVLKDAVSGIPSSGIPKGTVISTLDGDGLELRLTIPRDQAERNLFGFTLFADGKGSGLPILFRFDTQTIRVGTTEAPFSITDLPKGEDVVLRIFIDKYLVEVFANDRQALVASYPHPAGKTDLTAFSAVAPMTIRQVESWKITPTNQGFREAQQSRIWRADGP